MAAHRIAPSVDRLHRQAAADAPANEDAEAAPARPRVRVRRPMAPPVLRVRPIPFRADFGEPATPQPAAPERDRPPASDTPRAAQEAPPPALGSPTPQPSAMSAGAGSPATPRPALAAAAGAPASPRSTQSTPRRSPRTPRDAGVAGPGSPATPAGSQLLQGSGSPATPVKPSGMPDIEQIRKLPSTRFLCEHLRSETLAKLVVHLNAELGGDWAFSGSVALNVHAADLKGSMARPFVDADVQIANYRFPVFTAALARPASAALIETPARRGGGTHHGFDGMPVDLLDSKLPSRRIATAATMIAGIPVQTLEALRDHKTGDLGSGDPALTEKARADLLLIDELIGLRDARGR